VGGRVLVLSDKSHPRELPTPLEDLRHDPVLDRRRLDVDREVADLKAGLWIAARQMVISRGLSIAIKQGPYFFGSRRKCLQLLPLPVTWENDNGYLPSLSISLSSLGLARLEAIPT
jgi:hypothetical protein